MSRGQNIHLYQTCEGYYTSSTKPLKYSPQWNLLQRTSSANAPSSQELQAQCALMESSCGKLKDYSNKKTKMSKQCRDEWRIVEKSEKRINDFCLMLEEILTYDGHLREDLEVIERKLETSLSEL